MTLLCNFLRGCNKNLNHFSIISNVIYSFTPYIFTDRGNFLRPCFYWQALQRQAFKMEARKSSLLQVQQRQIEEMKTIFQYSSLFHSLRTSAFKLVFMAGPGGLTIMYKIENVSVVVVNQQMNWNSAVQIGGYLFTRQLRSTISHDAVSFSSKGYSKPLAGPKNFS